ncbi:MAG: tRNA pseudouridine synthase A, partial [Bacteriovoracaceae bacterium]|nr:tRNA pseudouridine synthase A [Bacteriovoracaceae bacterium]
MFFYRFTISYDGRPYQGWQSQPHQQTVQDTFDRVLAALGFQIPSLAAGRTDAGVHALGQVVRASSAQSWRPESLTKALNAQLPSTIRVQASALMPENFHPLKNAGKEYRYFWAAEVAPFCQGLLTAYDYPLDLVAMQKAAAALVGQHDFAPFACRGTPVKSTIREIFAVQLKTHSFPFSPSTPTSLSSVDSL